MRKTTMCHWSSARLISVFDPGYIHFHHPIKGCQASLWSSCMALPMGPIGLGVGVASHMAWATICIVLLVRTTCANKQAHW